MAHKSKSIDDNWGKSWGDSTPQIKSGIFSSKFFTDTDGNLAHLREVLFYVTVFTGFAILVWYVNFYKPTKETPAVTKQATEAIVN